MSGKYPGLGSTRLFVFAALVAAGLLAACGGGGAVPATPDADQSHHHSPSPAPSAIVSASPAASPTTESAAGTLPPMGVYNSCEIDTALPTCESQDSAIVSEGFKWEIDFIGLAAYNKTSVNPLSLQAWFTYDASIGLGQVLNVKDAIKDSNPLTGTGLVASYPNLASSCGATNDEQIISCVHSVASSVPNFNYEWYIYDEPGCPNQSIGYCAGSLAGGNYANVATLAAYIESIDPSHAVRGVQTPGGCGGGCTTGSNATAEAAAVTNLFSWITNSTTPNTGYDYDPIPENVINNHIGDIGYIAQDIASTISADYPSETMTFTVQAFSWLQEGWSSCTSITVCPYPTTAQMQEMRDEALYYANKAGKPLSRVYWYYWPDITCEGASTYSGCNSSANLASVKSAMTAPFPATPPPTNI